MAYQGIALVVAGGNTFSNLPKKFKAFGRMEIDGVPVTMIYMIIIVVVGIFVLKYINFFHQAYFIGSNKNSYVEGYTAINWLHQYVNGNLQVTKNYLEAKINLITPIVESGSIIITKDNMNQFKEKYTYDK